MMLFLLLACSDDGVPSWAFQHAEVSVEPSGTLHGFQIWEVYTARWSNNQKEKFHLCAYVQELSGEPLQSPVCPDCTDGYRVSATAADTDCEPRWLLDIDSSTADFELLVGTSLSADDVTDAISGPRQGWYQRFSDGEALPQGHIWTDSGATDALPDLVPEEDYILWPTSAWQLNPQ